MPYLGVTPAAEFTSKDLNGAELILDADADTTITADSDDQIDIKIAGADDFQFTANTFTAQSGSTIAAQALPATSVTSTGGVSGTTGTFTSTVDINGNELILDANANTSITADTDDQIDIKIAGADDFRFTANSFNILSGSTLTVDSGATITNSGTANNFGGGSWTFIAEANLSGGAAAGIDFTSGVSSTYDCYMLHMLDIVPTDDANMIQVRVYTGSSTLEDDAGDYVWVNGTNGLSATGNGTVTYYRDHSANELMLNNAQNFGDNAGENTSGLFYAYNVNSAGKTYFTWDIVHIDEGGNTVVGVGGGATTFTTAVTGFRVFSRDSNTESGTVRMYGLNKS